MKRVLFITSSYPNPKAPFEGSFVESFRAYLRGWSDVLAPQKTPFLVYQGYLGLPWRGGHRALSGLKFWKPKDFLIAAHFFLAGAWKTVRTCRKGGYDGILCWWIFPSAIFGWIANFCCGIPYDVFALGSDVWAFKKSAFGRALLRFLCARARYLYADGPSLVSDLSAITGRAVDFLPLGRERWEIGSADPRPPRRKVRFLFVGRYHPNKGPDILLEAYRSMFIAQRRECEVKLFGVGEMRRDLQEQAAKEGFGEGFTIGAEIRARDLASELADADYLILPSRIDSIPVIAVDALHAGVPIIAMPVGDLPWLIETYSCGILAQSTTPQALCKAMLSAIFSADRDSFIPGCKKAAEVFNMRRSAAFWEKRNEA